MADFPVSGGIIHAEGMGQTLASPLAFPASSGLIHAEAMGNTIGEIHVRKRSPIGAVCVDSSTAEVTFEIFTTLAAQTVDLANTTIGIIVDGTLEPAFAAGAFIAPYSALSSVNQTAGPPEDVQSFLFRRSGGFPADSELKVSIASQTTPGAVEVIDSFEWCTEADTATVTPPGPPAGPLARDWPFLERNLATQRRVFMQVAAGAVIYRRAMVAINSDGFGVPAGDIVGNRGVWGIAFKGGDNSTGADGDVVIEVIQGTFRVSGIGLVQADVGSLVYAESDHEVVLVQAANEALAGELMQVEPVWVRMEGDS